MKAKKCKKCDCPSWSGGLCKNHIERKPMKTSTIKTGGRRVGKKQSQTRYELFMLIWKKRGNKSEVSGEKIFGEPSSAHFHHILPKSKFPEGDLDEENIIILTMDEHANVENNMFIFDEVNTRRKYLLKKYNLI